LDRVVVSIMGVGGIIGPRWNSYLWEQLEIFTLIPKHILKKKALKKIKGKKGRKKRKKNKLEKKRIRRR